MAVVSLAALNMANESRVNFVSASIQFAEDQVVEVPIISVLWKSLHISDEETSAISLRQWLSTLLSRSILLGSVIDGVSMHDIVRDFTLHSHTPSQLQQLQRCFVSSVIDDYPAAAQTTPSNAATSIGRSANPSLTYHFKAAVTAPLCKDELAKAALFGADGIVDQALQGVRMGDIEALADWYLHSDDHWAAARL
jgi:hypothetical protein